MKVKAMSDLHGNLIDPGKCNILLLCGDISPLDKQRDHMQMFKWIFNEFVDWVNTLDCQKVFLTPGNHDFWFEKFCNDNTVNALRGATFNKLEVLIDREILHYYEDANGVTSSILIYGTPWCNRIGPWAFMAEPYELKEKYSKIPRNVDILITHEAPTLGGVGIALTDVGLGIYGSHQLSQAIKNKTPKYAICGHVHTGEHTLKPVVLSSYLEEEGDIPNYVYMANCSILNEEYKVAYDPLEFTIE